MFDCLLVLLEGLDVAYHADHLDAPQCLLTNNSAVLRLSTAQVYSQLQAVSARVSIFRRACVDNRRARSSVQQYTIAHGSPNSM